MTEILILYILSKYDATIYKIRKLIGEKFFMFSVLSFGTITPALKRLEELSCVEFDTKMTDGGLVTKTYKITPFGLKYLKSIITGVEFKNKLNMLNKISILICVSDILEDEEKINLFNDCKNRLLLLRADINNAVENPYNMYTELQKNVINANLSAVDKLLGEIQ